MAIWKRIKKYDRDINTDEEFAREVEEKMKETAVYFTELNKVRREDDNISVALIRAYQEEVYMLEIGSLVDGKYKILNKIKYK